MFSKSLLLLLLLPAFVVLLKIAIAFLNKRKKQDILYLKKDSLLTEAEKYFYSVLKDVIADNYLLFPQVSLLEILSVPKGFNQKAHYSALNKIQAKHIDFLLSEKETTRPLLVIELDDSSHLRSDRIARDRFLKEAFASANLPLLRVKVASQYDHELLKGSIKDLLDKAEHQV